jgi:hypothetical protein
MRNVAFIFCVSCVSAAVIAAIAACAGQLENPERFADYEVPGDDDASAGTPRPDSGGGSSTTGGATTGGQPMPEACGDVPVDILRKSCGFAGCHGGPTPSEGLDLETDGVAARLKGKPTKAVGFTLIDVAAPENSAIYTKLASAPPFGTSMPLGTPLDDKAKACVLEWVKGIASGG